MRLILLWGVLECSKSDTWIAKLVELWFRPVYWTGKWSYKKCPSSLRLWFLETISRPFQCIFVGESTSSVAHSSRFSHKRFFVKSPWSPLFINFRNPSCPLKRHRAKIFAHTWTVSVRTRKSMRKDVCACLIRWAWLSILPAWIRRVPVLKNRLCTLGCPINQICQIFFVDRNLTKEAEYLACISFDNTTSGHNRFPFFENFLNKRRVEIIVSDWG